MTNASIKILLIEDSRIDARSTERHLAENGVHAIIQRVERMEDLLTALDHGGWDVVLADHLLPGMTSLDALEVLRERDLNLPFIIVSGTIGEERVVEAMKAGAHDFVSKGNLTRLVPAIQRELRDAISRSQRREAELQLELSNQRLEEAYHELSSTQERMVRVERLQAIGQMASGIAHDFNNMLSKMMGVIEVLIAESDSEQAQLQQLRLMVEDGASVVRRLREYYQKPMEDSDFTPMDFNQIVLQAVDMTRARWKSECGARGIEIRAETELEEDLPLVLGSPSQFREVLTNLIFNACDAMPEGGRLLLRTRRDRDKVVIEVKDEGIGMSEEVRSRCLEAFYTTKGDRGTGLGLSIVQQLVLGLDGVLAIESEPARGTTIRMGFPSVSGALVKDLPGRAGNQLPVQQATPANHLKVMLVDDEPVLLQILERILELDGHQVTSFTSADEALESFVEPGFDLVISDRSMPQMNGDRLAVLIKERSPWTPFIMCSGFGDLMRGNGELPPGVDVILPKPVTRESLRQAIGQTCASGRDECHSAILSN